MDGMAMVTTLKSNAARNTAASITASAYQRRAFMTCRSCTRRAMQDGLLWCALFDSPADHCRFPRSSARPPSSLVGRMPRAERDAAGMPRAKGRRHENHDHGEPARNRVLALPACPGSVVYVQRIAPADVDPTHSTQTHVSPRQTCEEAGWVGTVGMIHSHPGGERCFYYFPGTEVASSDAESFARQRYPVDAIMCGDSIVWIGRDRAERQVRLADGPALMTLDHQPGNRVHAGTLAARGE